MEKIGKILIVDDNEDVLLSLNMLLKPHVEAIRVTTNPERIIEFMDSFSPDVIILDMNFHRDAMSGEEGYEWLGKILKHDPKSVVLFITAYVDTEKAVRAIKAGAVDFIPKPWEKKKLLGTVASAVKLSISRANDTVESTASDTSFDNFIGECPSIMELKEKIKRVATTEANILITGENGSGKDVVAHAIHQLSGRSKGPFVTIDLGCIPENLFESELFGYEKGAFTDAHKAKEGRIENADGGTLFLDEIGNLTPAMQQKLLTVIEKREMSRIGSTKVSKADIRLIAATNSNLAVRAKEGTFRQDLLYRINTIELHLPPLRERGNDILLLAKHFIDMYADKYGREGIELSDDARLKLMQYRWEGNVRELQHCMERAIVLSNHQIITAYEILPDMSDSQESSVGSIGGNEPERPSTLNLETLERNAIQRAISLSNGNLTQAAQLLGITRFALYRKIDKLGL